MLTTREVIKTFYNALVHKLKKYRGNWDQNDPTAADYIKNRPFYEDKSKKETVVKDTSFMTYGDYDWCSPFIFIPIEGKTYDVFFDGQKYSCTAYKDQHNYLCIGNIYIANDGNGLNTGEPFFYYWYDSSSYGALIQYSGNHTIKIEATEIVKMDRKYLPDNLIPNLAPVATSGDYHDLYNIPTIYTDVIRYDFKQTLTLAQKGQAKENIGLDEIDYNKLQNKPLGDIFYENITLNNLSVGSRGNLDSNVVFGDASYQCSVVIRKDDGTSLIIDNIEMLLDETESNGAVYYYTIGKHFPLYTYIKLYFSPSNGFAGIQECWEDYDTVDITIKNVMVKKLIQLDPKFLPDGVPVVPVETEDEGKVLGVSNGEYTLIDAPSSGMPETNEPHKYLVTDANGEVAWEDKLAWRGKEDEIHLLDFDPKKTFFDQSLPEGWTSVQTNMAAWDCSTTFENLVGSADELTLEDFIGITVEAYVYGERQTKVISETDITDGVLKLTFNSGIPFLKIQTDGAITVGVDGHTSTHKPVGWISSFYVEAIKPMDAKYITGAPLTESDNGKMLGVVDGAYGLVNININNITQTTGDELILDCN